MIVNYLKHKFYNLLTTMIVLLFLYFLVRFFLTFLGFGLYGLSRILIYFRLGDFTYNRSMYDNLLYYGSYIIFGYFIIFAVEHFNGLF
ncbi:SepA family multidrug efflux transporter [Staphylococcus aureus]|uniref:SepA family multidrug efflux transporter n=1 Tax=Staphylococcus aureus TaxID=1280 RepID=UPI003CE9DA6F